MEVLRAERRAAREAPPEVLERHAQAMAACEQQTAAARAELVALRATADQARHHAARGCTCLPDVPRQCQTSWPTWVLLPDMWLTGSRLRASNLTTVICPGLTQRDHAGGRG